ncbi:MAG: transposase, partial [Chloroflexota bacterium]|nr:transposase [Chloroflexota bacterium]
WDEAAPHVRLDAGLLIVDDTTLDKPYARTIELVRQHWSGKHHRVVHGINLVTLLWSDAIALASPVTIGSMINRSMVQPKTTTSRPYSQPRTSAASRRAWWPSIVSTAVWPTSS